MRCCYDDFVHGILYSYPCTYIIQYASHTQEMAGTTLQLDSKRKKCNDLPAASFPSHEYDGMLQNRDMIISQLAAEKFAGKLADKLHSKRLISDQVYEEGINFGPGIVESTRIRVMINAVLAKVSLNKEHYCTFISILTELEGLEDMIHLLQGKSNVRNRRFLILFENCFCEREILFRYWSSILLYIL